MDNQDNSQLHQEPPGHQSAYQASSLHPNQVVAVSHGIELYNLYNDQQFSWFSVYNSEKQVWLTYLLPKINGGNDGNFYLDPGEIRESCAVNCTPTLNPDGTIYIGGAGGVLNRLKPDGQGGYQHSYVILSDGAPSHDLVFEDNLSPVILLAEGDEPVVGSEEEPVSLRIIDGREVDVKYFATYRGSKLPGYDKASFNMLVEQGLVTSAEHEKIWGKTKRKVLGRPTSLKDGMEELKSQMVDELKEHREEVLESELMKDMLAKDGPSKEESIVIWERVKRKLTERQLISAANQLKWGLGKEFKGHLHVDGKYKPKMESLPLYKVQVTRIPGDNSQMIAGVMGNLYRINHETGQLTYIGKVKPEGERHVDNTALIALNSNTFVVGDMGVQETSNGPRTLKIVVDKYNGQVETDESKTLPLLISLSKAWAAGGTPNTTPRIKSAYASQTNCQSHFEMCATLFVRTKHAGNDVVQVTLLLDNGQYMVSETQPLQLTDTYNNEYMAALGDSLLVGRETEDYSRTLNVYLRGNVDEYKDAHIVAYKTGLAAKKVKGVQQPEKVLPPLPAFIPFTGYGLDGIDALD